MVSVGAAGCGKDKSPDDYQTEQSNIEFSKLQVVAGTFRGNLVTQDGSRSLGAVEIILKPVRNPVPNGDNSGTNARAQLQGSVTVYDNGSPSSGVITSANFIKSDGQDSDTTGTVDGQISVVLNTSGSAAQSASFSINGTMNGGQFNGLITPTDRSGVTGSFTVVKDAPLPTGQHSTNPGNPGQTRSYAGSAIDPNCDGAKRSNACPAPGKNGHVMIPVFMTTNAAPSSSGYAFVNLFADVKLVNVHLEIEGVNIPLPPVEFDQRQNSLSYNGSVSNGSSQIIFACSGAGSGYNCSYENVAQAATYSFTMMPGTSPAPPTPDPAPAPNPAPHHGGGHR